MTRTRTAALLALVVALVVALAGVVPVEEGLRGALRAAGVPGAVAFSALYAVVTVSFLPASVLTMLAGLVWGPWVGFAVVWPGAVVGAVASFVLGRTLLRDAVQARLEAWPRLGAVDRALGRDALSLVLLLRLSPLFPFNVLNYGLGLTALGLRDYALATAVGIVPGTFLYVYLGSTVGSVADLLGGAAGAGPGGQALQVAGLIATVAVAVIVARRARGALDARLQESP